MGIAATLIERGAQSLQAFRKMMYGMAAHEIVLSAVRLRADMEHLFVLVTIGDLIGVPILPPYYSLRLLPYLAPNIARWKRQMLRERDFVEAQGLDMIG